MILSAVFSSVIIVYLGVGFFIFLLLNSFSFLDLRVCTHYQNLNICPLFLQMFLSFFFSSEIFIVPVLNYLISSHRSQITNSVYYFLIFIHWVSSFIVFLLLLSFGFLGLFLFLFCYALKCPLCYLSFLMWYLFSS